MKRRFILVILEGILIIFHSCNNFSSIEKESILPENYHYNISPNKHWYLYTVNSYFLKEKINLSDLNDYPKQCPNCHSYDSIFKWHPWIQFNGKERYLKILIDLQKQLSDNDELNFIVNEIENSESNIYIAGCWSEGYKNSINYSTFYILVLNRNIIYRFKFDSY